MTTMARTSTGLAYPDRFYAAASFAGFDGSPNSVNKDIASKFSNEVALILYALYQQATVGPCNVPKPSSWSPVEQGKWKSWQELGNMASTEAMRLFVKILEEEDPGWYSRASNSVEPVRDVPKNNNSNVEPVIENGNSIAETKTISAENGSLMEAQDKDVVSEGLRSVVIYDQWVSPPITGQCPKARYEHGTAVVQDKMYIYGGNHNGRYLSDLHVLDLRSWTWSKVEANIGSKSVELSSPVNIAPCAGHSLIPWENKLLSIAGHTKDSSETIQVKAFDTQTGTWSIWKTYGKAPVSRGGQSVTLVGSTLVIFGGQDANRMLLNDLHILDLETMTWDEFDAVGVPPSPRSDHAAAVHAERYLLIFGGGSHATCFNDLHVLDLQAMEWSRPTQQGEIPTPRAGHAGVTVGENWFIVGGGDNQSGASETVVLNMSTLVWSVVTSVEGRVPLASEGLSLVVGSIDGEDILISFGGYNGRYNNEVNVLNPSHKSTLQSKIMEAHVPDSVSAVHIATNPTRDLESELEVGQEEKIREIGKIREIIMDNTDSEPMKSKGEETIECIIATLKAEKEELESSLNKEKLQALQLKEELTETETRNTDLYKELQSVRGQLAAEQSRCFKLEVDVAELRQKLQTLETLKKELELLQRQKAASEQALTAKQRQGSGVWGWLAGGPPQNGLDA
ncbi:Acyl-CoA-binding domain-containing protein 4 [Hibiscus syriacus]|uniref:Acyl-CoA-binding domain-containing protein 4 n=1 Tax=Hibiscus syriacus TaxID=106335 RepID=A0A6A2XIP3_HIBSY|nr:acyl-CoA-binding domain-containing protein 4-like isoform X2 [Hibiscus syriacus]KAE8675398.1 Acyl-CoA-binding domain-containing protein 4 [Hibiscus syriacus]